MDAIYITMWIWLGLIFVTFAVTLFKCYERVFVDDVAFQKHRRCWLRLGILWYFIGSVYTTGINTYYSGNTTESFIQAFNYDNLFYFTGTLPKDLLLFFIPFLMLLIVSLVPAKWQNWRSTRGKSK